MVNTFGIHKIMLNKPASNIRFILYENKDYFVIFSPSQFLYVYLNLIQLQRKENHLLKELD